jgi:hypothetical protein
MAKPKKPDSRENPAGNGDYLVGKGRPPFKPGGSPDNPAIRRAGPKVIAI